ncbi:MAG: cyclic nucleotide-binding domain-containing protein [Lautropia sp.]|nr:cyclic nucleotide-binding domain-containing protein [Lautropia sp.]
MNDDADLTETIEDSELLAILEDGTSPPADWAAAMDDMLGGEDEAAVMATVRAAPADGAPGGVMPGAALVGVEPITSPAAMPPAMGGGTPGAGRGGHAQGAPSSPERQAAGATTIGSGIIRMQGLRLLGSGVGFAEDLHLLLARTALFSGLGRTESRLLGAVMQVYEAETGLTLVTEGDTGDYMLLVMRGLVEVTRRDEHGMPVQIAVASPGQTLGEMSMVDGEPRFASCVTIEPCRVALLGRTALLALLRREPALGNKILLKLVSLLSERLRDSSAQLVNCLSAARPL